MFGEEPMHPLDSGTLRSGVLSKQKGHVITELYLHRVPRIMFSKLH